MALVRGSANSYIVSRASESYEEAVSGKHTTITTATR